MFFSWCTSLLPGTARSVQHYLSKCRTRQHFKKCTCFWPKISCPRLSAHVRVSITQLSDTGTRGKMKSRVTLHLLLFLFISADVSVILKRTSKLRRKSKHKTQTLTT